MNSRNIELNNENDTVCIRSRNGSYLVAQYAWRSYNDTEIRKKYSEYRNWFESNLADMDAYDKEIGMGICRRWEAHLIKRRIDIPEYDHYFMRSH